MQILNCETLAEESAHCLRAEYELITLEQLCALVGRTPQSIRRWESGAEPRFPKARYIAKRKYWLRSEDPTFPAQFAQSLRRQCRHGIRGTRPLSGPSLPLRNTAEM